MKNKILRLLTFLAVSGLLAGTATAQERTAPARRGPQSEERIRQLSEELKLTDQQKTKVKATLDKQREKVLALRNDTSLTREQRQEKMRVIREENQKELKTILTAEQYEKWEKRRDEMQTRVRERARTADNAPKPATDTQVKENQAKEKAEK